VGVSIQVFWSDSGELVCIAAEDSYYILQYLSDVAAQALASNEGVNEDGIEAALEVVGEVEETVKTGQWVGDCFIYTNSVNRLNYYVGGEVSKRPGFFLFLFFPFIFTMDICSLSSFHR